MATFLDVNLKNGGCICNRCQKRHVWSRITELFDSNDPCVGVARNPRDGCFKFFFPCDNIYCTTLISRSTVTDSNYNQYYSDFLRSLVTANRKFGVTIDYIGHYYHKIFDKHRASRVSQYVALLHDPNHYSLESPRPLSSTDLGPTILNLSCNTKGSPMHNESAVSTYIQTIVTEKLTQRERDAAVAAVDAYLACLDEVEAGSAIWYEHNDTAAVWFLATDASWYGASATAYAHLTTAALIQTLNDLSIAVEDIHTWE